MKTARILALAVVLGATTLSASADRLTGGRALWASINNLSNASLGDYQQHTGKVLISWRMMPGEDENTSFDLFYRAATSARMSKANSSPIVNATCFQTTVASANRIYYLVPGGKYNLAYNTPADERERIQDEIKATCYDSLLVDQRIWKDKLPYLSIPLQSTEDVSELTSELKYEANDCTVGDLDGDGEMEVIVKRLLAVYDKNGNQIANSEAASDTDPRARHIIVWDAYHLDGTLMWRVKSGPNIIAGNSSAVIVADLDGDGCAEFVLKTSEGTVFGDGQEILDTDDDGRTDYRSIWPAGHYTGDGPKGYGGPEFFSVVDGKTGSELARANFICRGVEGQTPQELAANWYQNDWKWDPRDNKYQWKLANSLRMGVASFTGQGLQIFLGRGVYGRTIVEGWKYENKSLTRMWKFDTMDAGGADRNKDGKPNSAYAGQGNHAFNVADLDSDGRDEVMYGSCAWDDDGTGLWTTGLGHGDANHVGKFLPDRDGLQVFHCLENGKTQIALHDARDGKVIWQKVGSSDNDMGRCMVADVDPKSPGCEFWMYGNELFTQDGKELNNSDGSRKKENSANAGIWFDGNLNRQMINENIINSFYYGRTFTMYRYDASFNNGTKSNPGWYGDFLGDWREEVIVPDNTKLKDIKIFTTWYPSNHKFPWLMTDHTYRLQCIHENVGYNQPTNLGYYLGSDLKSDAEAWASAAETQDWTHCFSPTAFSLTEIRQRPSESDAVYDLQGRRVDRPGKGIYIVNHRKLILK